MKYDYDETGANFSYFILSLLILFLVPYTIYCIKNLGGILLLNNKIIQLKIKKKKKEKSFLRKKYSIKI